jgi:protein O-GlcNAc transferase
MEHCWISFFYVAIFASSRVIPYPSHFCLCLIRGFLADLCLDTPAYNGHTTAADMLWSGTPIVTMRKDKMCSRVASSLLKGLGLEELSVDTLLDYEELAVSLANDQDRLYGFRRHIEQARENSATFDTKRWVGNFEAGLLSAWASYESGDPLSDVHVFDDAPTYMLDEGLM